MQWLKDHDNAGLIEFNSVVYSKPNMVIKYSDKPFDWLYATTPKLIHAFAKSMYENAWGLHWHIVETIEDQNEAQSA